MFKVGDEVSYGLHGKCLITAIKTKDLPEGSESFYQIRTLKNPITAKSPKRNDPFILIPVATAENNGLRHLMSKSDAENVLKLLSDRDYHFDLNSAWSAKQRILEEAIRKEGAIGLAKVVGHLFVMVKRDAAPHANVARFYETAFRILAKEISESMSLPIRDIEIVIGKALKIKSTLDS